MRVLVTGHKGYIGSIMVPLLQDSCHEVHGLDSNLFDLCTYGDSIPEIPSTVKDIRDVELADLEGFDAVIHLAGLSNDPLGDLDPELTYEINYTASVRLAELCKKSGIPRFIFASSCSNYGAAGEDLVDEEALLQPVTPYGRSKVLVEQEVSKLADTDFSPVFMRSATAYGVSCRLRFDLVVNNLVAWAYTTGQVYIKSDGTPWRPIVHIEDISRAFLAALESPRNLIHNQVFNVGRNEENYRVREIADVVKATVSDSVIKYADGAGPDKRCYRVQFDKISSSLDNYAPQWNVRKGAQQLLSTYQTYGLDLDEFEGPRYRRLDHLKNLINAGHLDNYLRWK